MKPWNFGYFDIGKESVLFLANLWNFEYLNIVKFLDIAKKNDTAINLVSDRDVMINNFVMNFWKIALENRIRISRANKFLIHDRFGKYRI